MPKHPAKKRALKKRKNAGLNAGKLDLGNKRPTKVRKQTSKKVTKGNQKSGRR